MLPILVRFGPVTIYTLGFFMAVGFLLATFVVWRHARKLGMNEEKILDTYFLALFLALIVGRLVYVWVNWDIFSPDYSRTILFMKYPGLSFPWFVVTFFGSAWAAAKSFGLEVLGVWDNFSLAAMFGAVLVATGCFFDGCLGGNLPGILLAWAVVWWLVVVVLQRKLAHTAVLADLAKKKGLFFLCYLIFQLVSLLMTQWAIGAWGKVGIYAVGIAGITGILVVRYLDLVRHVYHTVSQRRSHPN